VGVLKHFKSLVPALFCIFLLTAQANAAPEGFADLYFGAVNHWTADVSVSNTTSAGTTSASALIDLPTSTEFGVRFGAWHPTYNWVGMGIDLGYSHSEGPGVDITAFPMTLLLALRAPLFPTAEKPGGRLQPYAMAGVSFYITDITVHLNGMGGSSNQTSWPWPYSGNTVNKVVGPYLAAGLAWQATKTLALFGEYRYTSFDVDFDTTNSFLFPTANGHVDTTIRASRVLFGISHRFGAGALQIEAQP
jgi:hypothetical protein